jgi:hypothetical protein
VVIQISRCQEPQQSRITPLKSIQGFSASVCRRLTQDIENGINGLENLFRERLRHR